MTNQKQRSRALILAAFTALALVAGARSSAAWDCYGGFNPNATCSSQTTTYGSCWGCCQIIFDCNLLNRKSLYIALLEFQACQGHCITDFA